MLSKDVLPSGLRVVVEELPYVHSAAIGIWVGTGSKHELPENMGVSHFLEHMLFKGTKNRTAKEIAESLEAVGGQLNAFTGKEHTCFYAKVLSEDFDLAAEILSDMFLNSLFTAEDIKKEKNVILEEIKMYEDTPEDLVNDMLATIVWPDQPLGQPVIGTMATVSQTKRREMLAFFKSHYTPENVVISVAGNIKREQVVAKFSSLFRGFRHKKLPAAAESLAVGNGSRFLRKDIEQVHLCLGAPGLSQNDPDLYVLQILNNILGGGVSSRLFQEIREERGLTYSIYSYHSVYAQTGLLCIYAGTSYESSAEVMETILREILDIRERGVSAEELRRSKQQIKGTLLLGLESVSGRMTRLGRSEISLGKIVTVEEIIDRVMQVTSESVLQMADRIFQPEKLSLAVIGPQEPDFSLESLLAKTGFKSRKKA